MKIPALPRKLSRLPHGKVANPFKAGTRATTGRVKRALTAHTALFAANQIPGKDIVAGAIGHHLGGAGGATAAFGGTAAAAGVATALLGNSMRRRGKVAAYLSRRSKRTTGVYKERDMSGVADLLDDVEDAIAKAKGLIRGGGIFGGSWGARQRMARAFHGRSFGERYPSRRSHRLYDAAEYLSTRTPHGSDSWKGRDFTPPRYTPGGKKRTGFYKAGMIQGGSRVMSRRFTAAGASKIKHPAGARLGRADNYLRQRLSGFAPHKVTSWRASGKTIGNNGFRRAGVYKSLETLSEAIEKAKGLIAGGSRAARVRMRNGANARYLGAMTAHTLSGEPSDNPVRRGLNTIGNNLWLRGKRIVRAQNYLSRRAAR